MLLGVAPSPFFSIVLLSFVVLGIFSFFGPFWSLPNEFLSGFSAALGIALINSVGNLAGFAGPYLVGRISERTGSVYGGLAIAGISSFISAALVLLLRMKKVARAET